MSAVSADPPNMSQVDLDLDVLTNACTACDLTRGIQLDCVTLAVAKAEGVKREPLARRRSRAPCWNRVRQTAARQPFRSLMGCLLVGACAARRCSAGVPAVRSECTRQPSRRPTRRGQSGGRHRAARSSGNPATSSMDIRGSIGSTRPLLTSPDTACHDRHAVGWNRTALCQDVGTVLAQHESH